MATMIPALPTVGPFDSFFEESRKKFRSQVDRMWAEMQQEILNHRPLTFGSIKSVKSSRTEKAQVSEQFVANEEQSKRSTEVAKEDRSKNSVLGAKDGSFQMALPVTSFKSEELTVKVMGDSLFIEAHHEEKSEKTCSFSQRHFQQQFLIPRCCDKEALTSSLSAAGVLTVSAPSKAIEAAERKIEILGAGCQS